MIWQTVIDIITAAAIYHGVSSSAMINLAGCESTYNPSARNGQYTGLYQLGYGMQREFYSLGYDDLYDAAQQADFVAWVIEHGRTSNWPTYGRRCR